MEKFQSNTIIGSALPFKVRSVVGSVAQPCDKSLICKCSLMMRYVCVTCATSKIDAFTAAVVSTYIWYAQLLFISPVCILIGILSPCRRQGGLEG